VTSTGRVTSTDGVTGPGPGAAGLLVHGMGTELVAPDWAPLTDSEVRGVLAAYPGCRELAARAEAGPPEAEAQVSWRSPRPLSAAALVRTGPREVFVKRHDPRVRTAAQLAAEHAFAAHLRAHGVPVPTVLRTAGGATALTRAAGVYEVQERAPGADLYRDAMSWTPYTSLGHARAAGRALALLHAAAAGFRRRARPPAVLTSSCAVVTAADPVAVVATLAARRPGLGRYLAGRRWQDDLTRHHLPVIRRAAPLLAGLPPQWTHGDWHPSNLTWAPGGPAWARGGPGTAPDGPGTAVAGVIDLGLANRTFAVHDLATALERATVSWLDLAGTGRAEADLDAVDALLAGYQSVRPLAPPERAALAELLPVVHLEYALSEAEYFASVLRSPDRASLAYDTYLIGHTRWFTGPAGSALLEHLRRAAAGL
jgi:Ser/Thr protein kinase RdoA (MazF antagonist)